MLSVGTTLITTLLALAAFAVIAVAGTRRLGLADRDTYLTARGTQTGGALALTYFASALGAWILFAPPAVGALGDLLSVLGYAVGQAAAVAILAWLGPAVRARTPSGTTILEFVVERFGRPMQVWAGAVSVLYMFVFVVAELTAIGGAVAVLGGVDARVTVVAVVAVTTAYTAFGGLPASLATDRWQAWLVLALVAIGIVAVAANVSDPLGAAADGGLTSVSTSGAKQFVALAIAIVAANLFHQGFWQRVWAASDDRSVRRGALIGGGLIVPLIFLMGLAGMVAAGAGLAAPDAPALSLFALVGGLPAVALIAVVGLGVTLVASTVDTLQNALTSLVAVHVSRGRIGLTAARWVTVALTVPAAVIAFQGVDVLRIFLVADLLASTIAIPVFAGLSSRVTPAGAVAGSAAGLVSLLVLGLVTGQPDLILLPAGIQLQPFLVAPLASGAVTWLVSAARPGSDRRDVATGAAVGS